MNIQSQVDHFNTNKIQDTSNILDVASNITEPLQVMTYVQKFYAFYTPLNRQNYDNYLKNRTIYAFAGKLINYTDDKLLDSILIGANFYSIWENMSVKIQQWFKLFGELEKTDDKDKKPIIKPDGTHEREDSISASFYDTVTEVTQTYMTLMQELLDVEAGAIKQLTSQVVESHQLAMQNLKTANEHFKNNLRLKRAFVGSKFFIGDTIAADITPISAVVKNINFVTPNLGNSKSSEKTAAESYEQLPEVDIGANMDRVIKYYKDMLDTLGKYLLALFKGLNFPEIVSLQPPAFQLLWEQNIESSFSSLMRMCKARSENPKNKKNNERAIVWEDYEITSKSLYENVNWDMQTPFALFIGYDLLMYKVNANLEANVTRTNQSINNVMEIRGLHFLSCYKQLVWLIERNMIPTI